MLDVMLRMVSEVKQGEPEQHGARSKAEWQAIVIRVNVERLMLSCLLGATWLVSADLGRGGEQNNLTALDKVDLMLSASYFGPLSAQHNFLLGNPTTPWSFVSLNVVQTHPSEPHHLVLLLFV